MIINEINFRSSTLGYRQKLIVMLPQAPKGGVTAGKLRCLTLLHGLSDDETAWLRWSNVERYADEHGIAVVLPAVEKSFYTNMVYGDNFFDYVAKEVPTFIRGMLPISEKREDNYIAGLSMGGYGALKIALSCPESYSAVASLSGVVDVAGLLNNEDLKRDDVGLRIFELAFGDLSKVKGSQHDLIKLAADLRSNPQSPKIFQCCGTEDFLYQNNLDFKNIISSYGLNFTYEDGPGDHTWPYWDTMIQRVLNWIDLPQ